jgi:dephospho-CoA kinase
MFSNLRNWIITGGVGCGKSSMVSLIKEICGERSVVIFSSDAAVTEILSRFDILASIQELFGPEAVNTNGVCRQWLRAEVLPVPEKRAKLEKLLHPLVLSLLETARGQARASGCNLFLAEVPLHYEIGATVSADFVIVVASSRSVQVRRMMEKRGLDEHTVQKFLQAQWPIEAKVERADAVIWNDGSLASLEAQVLTLASPLLQA